MTLSNLAIVLGLVFGLPHIYGIVQPGAFGEAARRFPRNTPIGYGLMLAATGWFLYYLSLEQVSDFMTFKPALYTLFGAVGVGSCLFVKDFLPIRGLAVLMLLVAKSMVDTARWVDTEWRLVIVIWAYVWVFAGMWFTISPWRLRDMIDWATATPGRTRIVSAVRLGFGLFVVLLGLTAFRAAEARARAQSAAVNGSCERSEFVGNPASAGSALNGYGVERGNSALAGFRGRPAIDILPAETGRVSDVWEAGNISSAGFSFPTPSTFDPGPPKGGTPSGNIQPIRRMPREVGPGSRVIG
jgi:hypothetical protein